MNQRVPSTATPEEKINKEVLSNAISIVADALEDYKYNSHKWNVGKINPNTNEIQIEDQCFQFPIFNEEIGDWYRKPPRKYRLVLTRIIFKLFANTNSCNLFQRTAKE